MGILKEIYENDNLEALRWAAQPAYFNLLTFCNKQDGETELPSLWKENVKTNLDWLVKNKDRVIGSVWDLPKYEHTAAILIGASPILKRQWKDLKQADDRFVKIAVNSSAKFLVERKIIPDYVICVDGKTSGDWDLNLGKAGENIILLASLFIAPEILQAWPGKIVIVTHKVADCPKEMKRMRNRWGKYIPGGGNAFNAALIAFIMCTEIKIFLLAGNELSWKKHYYVHNKSAFENTPYYFATDVKGRRVRTRLDLYNYKVWLEHVMALSYPRYVFFNCSEGILGVDVDGELLPYIYQEPLKEAIELTKGAFGFEKLPWEEQNRLIYEDAYTRAGYHPTHSKNIWPIILKEIDFEKGLDVGCGQGHGMKIAHDQGKKVWGVDIADISKVWKELGINDYCSVAPAHKMPFEDNSFDFVVCTEVMEHIPKDGAEESLNEIYRVGSDKFLFTISLVPDNQSLTIGYGYHINVETEEFWLDLLQKARFEIAYQGLVVMPNSLVVLAVKNKNDYIGTGKPLLLRETILNSEKILPWENGAPCPA